MSRSAPSRSKAVTCADRLRERSGSTVSLGNERRLHDLQIAARQQRAGIGNGAGVAGKLHAVFGGAERGGANAFAGRQQRPWERAVSMRAGSRGRACRPRSPKSRSSRSIDIFADAAGEHHAVDAAEVGDRVGEIEVCYIVRKRPCRQRGNQRVGHASRQLYRARRVRRRRRRFQESRPRGMMFAGRDRAGRSGAYRRRPAGGRRYALRRWRSPCRSRRGRAWWCRRRYRY